MRNLKLCGALLAVLLSACAASDADPCALECSPLEECGAVYGAMWNDTDECFEGDTLAACAQLEPEPEVQFVPIDPDGNCWVLSGGGKPAGWAIDDTLPYACPTFRGPRCE